MKLKEVLVCDICKSTIANFIKVSLILERFIKLSYNI